MKRSLMISAALLAWGLQTAAHAETCTFTQTSSNWNTAGNWDCSHVPTAADLVTIPSGKTCAVDITNAVADTLSVASTGVLNIQSGKKLALDDDDGTNNTTITGTVNLQGSTSELAFTSNDQTIGGAGKISGADNAAKISIASGVTLTNESTIEGKLEIGGAGQFQNFGTVRINTTGTLLIDCESIEDDDTALWEISGSTAAILRINVNSEDVPILDGDWSIADGGKLDVDSIGFFTHGTLDWESGVVDVDGGCFAYFGLPL